MFVNQPGPFYFLSRYPEEAWDSEAIAHYFQHVAEEIRDPSYKTKLAVWKETGIDKYFTEHIFPEAESFNVSALGAEEADS